MGAFLFLSQMKGRGETKNNLDLSTCNYMFSKLSGLGFLVSRQWRETRNRLTQVFIKEDFISWTCDFQKATMH
jgi:hypothetical protein